MKYFLLFISLSLLNLTSFSQGKDKYAKLKAKYAEEKYEDVAFKAAGMSEKESMRRDPEPYLFLAMSYYQISKDEDLEEDYPKAYASAYKYAAKARKKDKSGKIYKEYKSFYDELKLAGIRDATEFLASGSYSKSAKCLKNINKFNPEDNALKFAKGVFNIKSNILGEGGLWVKESSIALREEIDNGTFELDPNSAPLFKQAFALYIDYLITKNEADSAKSTIALGLRLLPGDEKIQELANGLN